MVNKYREIRESPFMKEEKLPREMVDCRICGEGKGSIGSKGEKATISQIRRIGRCTLKD